MPPCGLGVEPAYLYPVYPPPVPDPSPFYADPVVYDILHARGTAGEARAIERIGHELSGHDGELTVLEPACGTARHLRRLAASGHRCVGFDLSEGMIIEAGVRARRAGIGDRMALFVADMTDFATRVRTKADIAFNLINTIRHLPDDASMLEHFAQVRACLKPHGAYVVGMSVTIYGVEQPSEDVWVGVRGPCRVTQTANYLPPESPDTRRETVLSHIHIQRPGNEEHRDCAFPLRTYSLGQFTALIDRSCLRLDRVTDDDGDPMEPPSLGYALFVLRPR